ncbi:hypothetical protein SO802_030208 [Lithocarpus litseifolius]|uniref:RNase H type-1 domain-containing protein n=1 Tax=Lithocarpus litseifolius TaxID=425828 RepID=A0AAW2BHJ1_9ROSI
MGLREGLILCCNFNITSHEIELDAKAIVDCLNKPTYVNNIISPILDDCSPPVDLLDVFEDDLSGMYVNRLCPELDVPL